MGLSVLGVLGGLVLLRIGLRAVSTLSLHARDTGMFAARAAHDPRGRHLPRPQRRRGCHRSPAPAGGPAEPIANSVKYLREDGPKNTIVSAERRRGRVNIEVSDAGKGIPRSALERVFDTGFRADGAEPGLGIGLATVKRLVDGYGGRVVLRSREGYGTNACVELPAAAPRGPAEPGA